MKNLVLPLFALALVALTVAPAQTPLPRPGFDVAVVSVKQGTNQPFLPEFYLVDPAAKKAWALNTPTSVAKVGFNAVKAVSPVTGYLTTIDGVSSSPSSAGDLYSYVIAGPNLQLKKLNTKPFTGGNLAQVAQIGGNLYVSTQDPAGNNGMLWSVPAAGGPPTMLVDMGKVTGFGGGLINGMTAMGGKIYLVAGWYGTYDELWEYDPATKTTSLVVKFTSGGLYSSKVYPIHLSVDTNRNLLVVVGLYRDVAYVDVKGKKIINIVNGGKYRTSTKKPHYHQMLNSGVYNPYTGDIDLGTRVGNVDFIAGSHGTLDMIGGVGSSSTAANNSVTGIDVLPANGSVMTFGDSGMGGSPTATYRFYPINLSMDYPMAGKKWGSRIFGGEGGAPAILAFGLSSKSWSGVPLPLDLTPFGAPGNHLYCSQEMVLATVLAGTGSGSGEASFSFTLPAASLGTTLHCQWLVLDKQANSLGLVGTNARTLMIK